MIDKIETGWYPETIDKTYRHRMPEQWTKGAGSAEWKKEKREPDDSRT